MLRILQGKSLELVLKEQRQGKGLTRDTNKIEKASSSARGAPPRPRGKESVK